MDVDLLAVALRDSVARLSDQGLRDLLARLGEDSRADLLRLLQPRGEEHGAPRAASPVLDEEDDGMEEEEGKKFPCPACQRQFSRKWNCERHFQKAHGSRARFVCEQPGCKQSFGVAKDLERHVAAMHGGEHEQRSSHSSAHEADIKRTKTQVDEYLGIIAQRQSPGMEHDGIARRSSYDGAGWTAQRHQEHDALPALGEWNDMLSGEDN